MTTYGEALAAARAGLRQAGASSAALDARLLLGAAAGLGTAALIARSRDPIPPLAKATFDAHVRRRLAGEPVARIIGEKEFWGLAFALHPATLEPRPDTEILVDVVLAEARRRFPRDLSICDLGTGSGAIIVTLLAELPGAQGTATDVSEEALAIAQRNAERHGVAERLRFQLADFASGPDGAFDVVASNPPYVASGDIDRLDRAVRDFDPRAALDGGPDGLAAYRAIVGRLPARLAKGGLFVVETGHDQSDVVAGLCRGAGLDDVAIVPDLAGIGRVVRASASACWPPRRLRKKRLENSAYQASVAGAN